MSLKRHPRQNEWDLFMQHPSNYYMDGIPPDYVISTLPKPEQYAHYFWTWVWFLSIPACVALVFIKWWLVFSVLIVPGMIRNAAKTTLSGFIQEKAQQDEKFFQACFDKGIIKRRMP